MSLARGFLSGLSLPQALNVLSILYVILGRRNLFEMGAVRSARDQWRSHSSQPDIWSCKYKFFCVYRPYKEPISKEINNDNHLNLHLHDQMSGWLRYCSRSVALVWRLGILVTGVVLCTWKTIIESSGLQLLWEEYVFFGFFVCILYNIITIQYNLIL